ncbi:MAG: hypothetical protein WBA12_05180 [Catalinimonas sp.]
MTNTIFKVLLILLVSGVGAVRAAERTKRISKQFNVTSSDRLRIDNTYGKVHVNTTAQGEITIEVEITVRNSDADDLDGMLDRIEVDIRRDGETIRGRTQIDNRSNWLKELFNWSTDNDPQMEINWTINMPPANALDVENRYGSVYLDDFRGPLRLDVRYGTLRAERITSEQANVKVAYGAGDVKQMTGGRVDVSYSSFELEEGGNLAVETSYSNLQIDQIEALDLDGRYGNVEIDEVSRLTGEVRYSGCKLGTVREQLALEVGYCPSFSVRRVAEGFQRIDVESEFSSIRIHFDKPAAGRFDVAVSYGSFRAPGLDLNYGERREDNNTFEARGTFGSQGTARVNINARYGDVRLD